MSKDAQVVSGYAAIGDDYTTITPEALRTAVAVFNATNLLQLRIGEDGRVYGEGVVLEKQSYPAGFCFEGKLVNK